MTQTRPSQHDSCASPCPPPPLPGPLWRHRQWLYLHQFGSSSSPTTNAPLRGGHLLPTGLRPRPACRPLGALGTAPTSMGLCPHSLHLSACVGRVSALASTRDHATKAGFKGACVHRHRSQARGAHVALAWPEGRAGTRSQRKPTHSFRLHTTPHPQPHRSDRTFVGLHSALRCLVAKPPPDAERDDTRDRHQHAHSSGDRHQPHLPRQGIVRSIKGRE